MKYCETQIHNFPFLLIVIFMKSYDFLSPIIDFLNSIHGKLKFNKSYNRSFIIEGQQEFFPIKYFSSNREPGQKRNNQIENLTTNRTTAMNNKGYKIKFLKRRKNNEKKMNSNKKKRTN